MIFHARGERALACIEAGLTASDPGLAAKFGHFNRLVADSVGRQEQRDHRQRMLRKICVLLLLPLVAFAVWVMVTAGSGHGGATGCTTGRNASCPQSRSSCWAGSTLAAQDLGLPSCRIQPVLNAPSR